MTAVLLYTIFGSESTLVTLGADKIPCFILNNGQHLLSKKGITKALGYDGKSNSWIIDLLESIGKFRSLPEILSERTFIVLFEIRSTTALKIHEGIGPEAFIEICKLLVDAKNEGYLNISQLKFAKAAEKVLGAVNDKTISLSIEEATGFLFHKTQCKTMLQHFFDNSFDDASLAWVKTFPDSFYKMILEAHQRNWQILKEEPHAIGKIIFDIVYSRMPQELIVKLRNTPPKRTYKRKNYVAQELVDPDLREYLNLIASLLETSGNNWNIFLRLIDRRFPKNPAFTVKFPIISTPKKTELSLFNQRLLGVTK